MKLEACCSSVRSSSPYFAAASALGRFVGRIHNRHGLASGTGIRWDFPSITVWHFNAVRRNHGSEESSECVTSKAVDFRISK